MRALVITVGSRGDAEPFVSLARSLGQRHHQVDLFLQKDLIPLSTPLRNTNEITIHELPFTQMDFYRYSTGNPSHGAESKDPRVRFVGVVADVIGELVLPCTANVLETATAAKSNMIITSSLAQPLVALVARKLNNDCIPLCVVNLQPVVPTRQYPHFSQALASVQRIMALMEHKEGCSSDKDNNDDAELLSSSFEDYYWELEECRHAFLQERLDALNTRYNLPPLKFDANLRNSILGRDGGRTLVANAYSTELIPPSRPRSTPRDNNDNKSTLFDIGALADAYIPDDWTQPDDLQKFLQPAVGDENDKDNSACVAAPICIGFGSMPFEKAAMVVDALLHDKLLENRKAVLVGKVFVEYLEKHQPKDPVTWSQRLLAIASAPYAWLLPRCSVMVSHGGAGVVHVALRAGIPNAVVPLFGDQFFWAELLSAHQLGTRVCNQMAAMTPDDLVRGILAADACVKQAQLVGERIRSSGPTGVEKLVQVLEERAP